jgi:hypothetical protein
MAWRPGRLQGPGRLPPELVADVPVSWTGQFLKPLLAG